MVRWLGKVEGWTLAEKEVRQMTKRKIYTVIGIVSYENTDTLGIYTSKDAAIKAATKIANRKVDYYADYINYDFVHVYSCALNTAIDHFDTSNMVWNSETVKRTAKRNAA